MGITNELILKEIRYLYVNNIIEVLNIRPDINSIITFSLFLNGMI